MLFHTITKGRRNNAKQQTRKQVDISLSRPLSSGGASHLRQPATAKWGVNNVGGSGGKARNF